MPKYNYVALDARGKETKGTIEVASQNEAIGRVKEMGLFPTKIVEADKDRQKAAGKKAKAKPPAKAAAKRAARSTSTSRSPASAAGSNPRCLTTFTRQLATLVDAGLPLLRGLRVLEKQETQRHAQGHPRRTGRVHRGRQHLFRGAGAASQGFQPPVREHGQGRRTGRRARSRAQAPGGIHPKRRRRSRARSRPPCFIPSPC